MATMCYLYIANCTKSVMTPGASHIYQMELWNFSAIPKLSQSCFSVQFDSGHYDEDDSAHQNYVLTDYNSTPINIYGTSDNKSVHWLSVESLGATAPNYLVVATCGNNTVNAAGAANLTWAPVTGVTTPTPPSHTAADYVIGPITSNGMAMGFALVDLAVLVGEQAATYFEAIKSAALTHEQTTILYAGLCTVVDFSDRNKLDRADSWMTASWSTLQNLKLSQVCMPGTHDAGMGVLTDHTAGSNACNTVTQRLTVAGQLAAGSRFFDLRPCGWPGLDGLYCAHWAPAGAIIGIFGGAGQSIASVLSDVAAFCAQPNKTHELIVLKFSHFGNVYTDSGVYHGSLMSQQQFEDLVSSVQTGLAGYLFTSTNAAINLNEQTMQTLSGSGNRVLAVFDLGEQKKGEFPAVLVDTAQGIFGYRDYWPNQTVLPNVTPNMMIYDSYAKTDKL